MTAVNGELVRQTRLGKGLTQQQVVDRCKELGQPVAHNLLSKIESGGLGCSPAVVPVLAAVLDLSIEELAPPKAGNSDDEAAAL